MLYTWHGVFLSYSLRTFRGARLAFNQTCIAEKGNETRERKSPQRNGMASQERTGVSQELYHSGSWKRTDLTLQQANPPAVSSLAEPNQKPRTRMPGDAFPGGQPAGAWSRVEMGKQCIWRDRAETLSTGVRAESAFWPVHTGVWLFPESERRGVVTYSRAGRRRPKDTGPGVCCKLPGQETGRHKKTLPNDFLTSFSF